MSATAAREHRVPLSLRLPKLVVERVDDYAAASGVSRTDAFLHYLELGMGEAEQKSRDELLSSIDTRLEEALQLLSEISAPYDASVRQQAGLGVTAELTRAIDAVCEAFPAIERAYVFGSFARGAAGPESDVDIRIELDRDAGFNLHDLDHFCKQLEQSLGRDVDVVSAREIKNEALKRAIERDKVLVYERKAR